MVSMKSQSDKMQEKDFRQIKFENERARVESGRLSINFDGNWRKIELDDYEDISVISHGANAATVSGIHKRTLRKDCIKIYTPNLKAGRKVVSVEQYLKEVRKLAALRDPRIVTVYDAFDIDENIHVVTMEYIEGKTLNQWITDKTTWNKEQDRIDRLNMSEKILEAVLSYQQKGFIHGDLHLKNILVDKDQEIHIIDFGTSHFAKQGQSEKRESFFVFDLVRKILGEWFFESFFSVICPRGICSKKTSENDVRNKYPVLITRTMLAYVRAYDKLLQLPPSDIKPPDIVTLCNDLASAVYMDFDYAIKRVWLHIGKRLEINIVASILYENLEENITPEIIDNKPEIMATLPMDLLDIYFKYSLLTRDQWDLNRAKEHTFKYSKGRFHEGEYDKLLKLIMKTEKSTYEEFKEEIIEAGSDDSHMMQIMFDALEVHIGVLPFAQILWVELNERRWARQLLIIH